MANNQKVAIIGAGPSGLTAIKSCLEECFQPVCYEKGDNIGGLWRYREEDVEGMASVMRNTIINTGKERSAFSDFPPDKSFPHFMHHSKMLEYFEKYAAHFGLLKYIKFNFEVIKVEPTEDFDQSGRWMISTRDTSTSITSIDTFDAVMVCIGHHVYPNIPILPNQHVFKGTITHTHSLKSSDRFKGKIVAVIGIGNSGVDAATDAISVAKQVYLSTRKGAWVFSRIGPNGQPLDLSVTRLKSFFDSWKSYDTICDELEKIVNSRLDHALFNLKPKHRILEAHGTLNDALPSAVISGRVIIKGDVERFEDDGILFAGENEVTRVDAVVLATGYLIKFPFLDHSITDVKDNEVHLYKYIIPPKLKHPTLAIIGLVQPWGSIIPLSEMQCRWFIQLLAGNMKLPTIENMEIDILKKKEANTKRYVASKRHTIQVDYLSYLDELAEMIGVKPNLLKLALKDQQLFWAILSGPIITSQYRLDGPHTWANAREAVLSYKHRRFGVSIKHEKTLLEKDFWVKEIGILSYVSLAIVICMIFVMLW